MSDEIPMNGNQDERDDGRPEPDQADIRTREQAQVHLIAQAFGKEVEIEPANWDAVGADRIYRRGSFLVRDRDLPRIRAIFGQEQTVFDGIDGLTVFQPPDGFDFPPDAPAAPTRTLRYIALADQLLGRGVAELDHVVYTCSVSPCPATEPMEVPVGVSPNPAPVAGDCDGRGVKVVVVDVGWTDPGKPWLAGVTGEPEDAFAATGDIVPYAGHGTFIAGVLRCVAPRADVEVKAYLNRAGAQFGSNLVVKLQEALADNPDLISLSAGVKLADGDMLLALEVFLDQLDRLKGVVLVAAAGNEGSRDFFFPAASPGTVSVGALAEDGGHRATFSNHGGWVDVYAPGENIVNAYLTGDFECNEPPYRGQRRHFDAMARWSGTSFATPLVAGLIAGRMSVTGENARQAADALLAYALDRSIPGVGRVLLPDDACASIGGRTCCHGDRHCRSHCGNHC